MEQKKFDAKEQEEMEALYKLVHKTQDASDAFTRLEQALRNDMQDVRQDVRKEGKKRRSNSNA